MHLSFRDEEIGEKSCYAEPSSEKDEDAILQATQHLHKCLGDDECEQQIDGHVKALSCRPRLQGVDLCNGKQALR